MFIILGRDIILLCGGLAVKYKSLDKVCEFNVFCMFYFKYCSCNAVISISSQSL